MNQHEDHEDPALEALLSAAKEQPATVTETLMARVLADAEAQQAVQKVSPRPNNTFWMRVSDLLGGWQGMGGLVAATCAGVWIGVNPPATLPDAGALLLGYETAELMSTTAEMTSFGWDLDGE